ncbi:hypothetical protein GCM10022393_17250 [Aquimarina addita]|uniref:P/Homo B domain-containing protein n=2 Tax=Aquimarina addita TaxID=870485 RepID=A0ABP7XHP5_9FLAO
MIGVDSYAQTKKPVKSKRSWTSSSMRIVPAMSSKSKLIPASDYKKEVKDGRSSKVNPIIGKGSTGDDPLTKKKNKLQQKIKGKTPELVFDSAITSSAPTDPSIAIGLDHVIAVFNTGYRIFDKSGTPLTDQLAVENIFSSGGCCDLTVSYDNAANRWVISYLFFSGAVEIAVSQGPDPLNDTWSVYRYDDISDYQKLSVWSDAYYMTANVNSANADTEDVIFALDRNAMLAGEETAQIIAFSLPGIETGGGFYSPQAFNVSNAVLPATGNAPIVYMQDDAFTGITEDHLKIWTVNVDFETPANATISQPVELVTTPFVSVFNGGSFANLQQPNGGALLDALQATVMNQAQFRKFDTYNSAVFSFAVDTDGSTEDLAGIRWYELRQAGDGQPWSIYQEGTYTSTNGKHAWNGSMMMDDAGNIALGYSGMGGTTDTFVSSYYSGRFSSDPLGTMSISETLIAAGTGNIPVSDSSDNSGRYGDYGKMDIDPVNDRTFWHINEYMNTDRANVVGVFQIAPDKQNDVGIISINLPDSEVFSATQDITVSIFNYGTDPATNFDVTYQIDEGTLITETFTGTIASNTTADFTFAQSADLSIEGQTYIITSATDLVNDQTSFNDETTIEVTNLYSNNLGITTITSPATGEDLGTELVTVTIQNYGGEPQSGFDISYRIDGGTPVIETFSGTIDPISSSSYTFSTPADLSVPEFYEITATTLLASDAVPDNDSATIAVENQACQSFTNNTPQSIGTGAGDSATSIITIENDFVLTDVNVGINIEHTYTEDLTITLIAPDGITEVQLSSENGGASDNYTNTIFDDEATESITDGSAPFTGSFTPEENLGNLDGSSSLGDWTLFIEDGFNQDGGQLLDWTLQLCDGNPVLAVVGEDFEESSELLIIDKGNNQYDISFLTTEITEMLDLQVYNAMGQKVLHQTLQNKDGGYTYQLDMSYAATGIYIVALTNGSNAQVGKILKR